MKFSPKGKIRIVLGVLMILLMSATLITGCKKKSDRAEAVFKQVLGGLQDIASVREDYKITLSAKENYNELFINMNMKYLTTTSPVRSEGSGKIEMSVNGAQHSFDISTYSGDDKSGNQYLGINSNFLCGKAEHGSDDPPVMDFEYLSELSNRFFLRSDTFDVKGEECYMLVAEITVDQFTRAFSTHSVCGTDITRLFENLGVDGNALIPFHLYVYVGDKLPAKVEVDFTKVVDDAYNSEKGEISELKLELVFRDYDSVKSIKVPEEVRNFASKGKTELYDLFFEDHGDYFQEKLVWEEEKVVKFVLKPAKQSKSLGSEWDSFNFKLQEEVFTLPCNFSDIEKSGLKLDETQFSASDEIKPHESKRVYLGTNNNLYDSISITVFNPGDEAVQLSECLVVNISVDSYSYEEGINLILPAKITIGSSREKAMEKYGVPTLIQEGKTCDTLIWYTDEEDTFKFVSLSIDKETGKVNGISIQYMGE